MLGSVRVRSRVSAWQPFALALISVVALAACAAPAQQLVAPKAAEPAKPAAQAAQPAKPAAQPAPPAAPASKPQPIVLNMGCSTPKGDVLCDAEDKFAELVEKKTNGQVIVKQHYQALGQTNQLTQAVQTGSVDIGDNSNGNLGRFTNAFFVYDLPFLFKSYDNMLKSWDTPLGRQIIEKFEKDVGVKMLFPISYGGGRDVQTRSKPLKTPADIKGLKIRVVSTPIDLTTFKAWGANPTPVDWAQTYTALQQGVVDGEQIPMTTIVGAKHYEVIKHSLRLDYQAIVQFLFINAKKFEALSPEHQKALLEAANEAKEWNRKDAADKMQKTVKQLTDLGVTIYTPTPAEYQQWAAIREKVWQEVGEQFKDKLDLNLAKQIYESQ